MLLHKITPFRAATAVIFKKNKLLLIKRSPKSKTYPGYWQLPEGKINFFEDPQNTISRELKEEIGYIPTSIEKLKTYDQIVYPKLLPTPIKRIVFKVNPPKKVVLSHEHSDFKWVNRIETKNLKLVPGTEDILIDQMM